MTRIAITVEAFDAICATLPVSSVVYEVQRQGRAPDLDRAYPWPGLHFCARNKPGRAPLRRPGARLPDAMPGWTRS
jgi:hypothetical protein